MTSLVLNKLSVQLSAFMFKNNSQAQLTSDAS
jgi:hypothetical protein